MAHHIIKIITNTTHDKPPCLSIALISAGALAYEILLMRLFSIIQWHHFAYMIISLALLGYGASGTYLSLYRKRLLTYFPQNFVSNILLFGISSLLFYLLAQQIPFNPQEILWDAQQPLYLMLLYLCLALPFFFVANAIGLALMQYRQDISRLYAADMLGAGAGSLAIVLLLFIAFPNDSLRFISAIGIATAAIACWELRLYQRLKWVLLLVALLPLILPGTWLAMNISPYKGLSQTLRITGAELVTEYSSPLGMLSVVKNSVVPLRHAPGLSLNATQEPPAQIGVFTDGDAMTVINEHSTDDTKFESFAYLDQLTSAAPYHLQQPQKVLVLGAGGGSDVLQAHYHGVESIDAVELNPQMVDLLQQDYAQFSGGLYKENKTKLHTTEARGFVTSSDAQYDLIQVALLDAFSASSAGLYALSESYLYTVEALQEYLQHVTPDGYLAISRWIKLPPRDTLKLFATAVAAINGSGVKDATHRIMLIRSWQTSTLLIKNGSFNAQEIKALKAFCEQRAFDLAYYPGMPAVQANRFNRLRESVYYQAASALLSDERDAFIKNYKFNIQPATDDKPYFFNFLKWSVLPEVFTLMGRGGMPLLEWGYLVLVATLVQALVLSLMLIVLPLLLIRRAEPKSTSLEISHWQVFGYFTALGLGFLFIEIAFIQKFILLLHHPLYSVSVVLVSFFIFAGMGSAFSKRYSSANDHASGVKWAVMGICCLGVVYLLLLGPVFSLILDWPMLAKAILSIVFIAPLAFCMGMPFPLGLSLLGDRAQHLIPWAWGVNGCASVLSAVLATLLAIHFGFTVVVVLLLYGAAALIMTTTPQPQLPESIEMNIEP